MVQFDAKAACILLLPLWKMIYAMLQGFHLVCCYSLNAFDLKKITNQKAERRKENAGMPVPEMECNERVRERGGVEGKGSFTVQIKLFSINAADLLQHQ